MALMLAPLSLRKLDPDSAAPFSGDVAQNINPWQWIAKVMGNQFSLFTVNLGHSSAPEVEAEILDNVAPQVASWGASATCSKFW